VVKQNEVGGGRYGLVSCLSTVFDSGIVRAKKRATRGCHSPEPRWICLNVAEAFAKQLV
jgi:hypothetical protein